jgi:hypothetical protein
MLHYWRVCQFDWRLKSASLKIKKPTRKTLVKSSLKFLKWQMVGSCEIDEQVELICDLSRIGSRPKERNAHGKNQFFLRLALLASNDEHSVARCSHLKSPIKAKYCLAVKRVKPYCPGRT